MSYRERLESTRTGDAPTVPKLFIHGGGSGVRAPPMKSICPNKAYGQEFTGEYM